MFILSGTDIKNPKAVQNVRAAQGAAPAVQAAADLQSVKISREAGYMGDSTGSMFYMFAIFIGIYVVGMLIYQGYQMIRKWRKNRRTRNRE